MRAEAAMPKRIALFYDGTWNAPSKDDSASNVSKLYQRVRQVQGVQAAWYDAGVGTAWQQRIRGGLTGYGIGKNIMQGYAQLARQWQEGDTIYVFGFSRGAYTARSLVGLVRKCWILKEPDAKLIEKAYDFYRRRGDGPDAPDVDAFRRAHGRQADIHVLGVWDTVGALGIPGGLFKSFNEKMWGFHDTTLSGIVKNAFHAVAVDEHRPQYEATLWADKAKPGQSVEQRWFAGAHSNVGGGYPDARLSDLALEWMAERAAACGLDIGPRAHALADDSYAGKLRDSYAEFLGWFYRKITKRFYRPVKPELYRNTLMTIDQSVKRRREDKHCGYRPPNLPA
jgi:uncharacterized protein (DUF2235 family)